MNKFTMNFRNVLVATLSNLSGCLMCLTFLFIFATPGLAEFRALDVHSPNLLLGMPQGDYAQQEFVFRTLYVSCIDREKNQPRFLAYRIRLRHIAGDNDLERHWRPEELLDADEQLEDADYKGVKIHGETVDRRHL